MKWEKIGFVSLPPNNFDWMRSHCQLPTVLILNERNIRVFFASRTDKQESHVAFMDLELGLNGKSFEIRKLCDSPILSPGPIGYFDEHGVYPSCVIKHQNKFYMFYIGWNKGAEAPLFYANIGLAVSEDGLKFQKISKSPLLSRSEFDPCLVTSPHVYFDDDKWRMTYVSGVRWERSEETGKLQSHYHIKYAESNDLLNWVRQGIVAIDFEENETNIARSSVIKLAETDYRMWYSYVHSQIKNYRIGYAESHDGFSWERKDHLAGIDVDNDFATEMICYPCVFNLGEKFYMLYNGDSYGKNGFGIALWGQ
jgi:predicted GH43/DUF377 family glycosyl hydrolase